MRRYYETLLTLFAVGSSWCCHCHYGWLPRNWSCQGAWRDPSRFPITFDDTARLDTQQEVIHASGLNGIKFYFMSEFDTSAEYHFNIGHAMVL